TSSRACAPCCSQMSSAPIISFPRLRSTSSTWGSAPPPFLSPSRMPAGEARCCRWANDRSACGAEHGEPLLFESRLCGGRFEKGEKPGGLGIVASGRERHRIDDRWMAVLGKDADDSHAGIGRRIGGVDDAERRFSARYEQ